MASDSNSSSVAEPVSISKRSKAQIRASHRLASRIFGGSPRRESVSTHVRMAANPETLWRCIQFYEEIPGKPPLLLRALIPAPLRTQGEKTTEGSIVFCEYERGGSLVKRITALKEPHFIEFEVLGQSLGIERCVCAEEGSYRIYSNGRQSTIVLTTTYLAYLRPRWLWAPVERLIAHQLHKHILRGMVRTLAAVEGPSHNKVTSIRRTRTLEG